MQFLKLYFVIILGCIFLGLFQQQSESQNVEGDGLLKMYDQMIADRQKQISRYTQGIKNNPNSAELFYKRALVSLEIRSLNNALGECWEYKNNGGTLNKDERSEDFKEILMHRMLKKSEEGVGRVIIQHPDCHKSGDSRDMITAYGSRTVNETMNEQYHPISDISRAIELNSNFYEAYVAKADYTLLGYGNGDFNPKEDYSKAIDISPARADLYCKRGILSLDDDQHNAFMDCSRAIQLNPQLAEAYVCRSQTNYDKNCPEAANDEKEIRELRECEKSLHLKKLNDLNMALSIDPSFRSALEWKKIEEGYLAENP